MRIELDNGGNQGASTVPLDKMAQTVSDHFYIRWYRPSSDHMLAQ
jgi:hypothetical protein